MGALLLAIAAIRRRDGRAAAVCLLMLASYLAVCLPAQFWPHYYYLMIPSLVLAVCIGIGGAFRP